MGVNKIYNVYKGLKKVFSKTDDTITGIKPKGGRTDTRAYKENLMQKRLGNEQKKMEDFATKKRKEGDKQ